MIWFGPGLHEVSHQVVTDNQSVYVAGGAIVRGVIRPDEKFQISSYSGLRTYAPTFLLKGTNITSAAGVLSMAAAPRGTPGTSSSYQLLGSATLANERLTGGKLMLRLESQGKV